VTPNCTNAFPRNRVDEVIGLGGPEEVAGKRSKGFSLGMSWTASPRPGAAGSSAARCQQPKLPVN